MVLLVLVVFITLSVRWSVADVAVSNVRWTLDRWARGHDSATVVDWEDALGQLQFAHGMNRNEAEYFKIEGELYERRAFIGESRLPVPEFVQILEHSRESFHRSADLRPSWPDTWALLARQKATMEEFDEEFHLALERAVELGAWESRIQLIMIEVASRAWPYIEDPAKQQIARAIEKGLSIPRTDRFHVRLLRFSQILPEVCPYLDRDVITEAAATSCDRFG